jgi:cytochrome c553
LLATIRINNVIRLIQGLLCGMLLVSLQVVAAGDPAAGRIKAETCLGCHAIPNYSNVYPSYHVPKLAGQNADYIVQALKGYQNGARKHSTMHANSSNLSEQDMADIAAFFSSAATHSEETK